jgi:adenosylcobyric acid synthase
MNDRYNYCSSLAVLGTGSDVGKSTITAGICRVLTNHGLIVAPFKGQNMSNNSKPALLPDGEGYGEIGIAQAIQAEACHMLPRVEMNPVLLKSGGRRESDGAYLSSVLVMGRLLATEDYGQLKSRTETLMDLVLDAHCQLHHATNAQVIIMEGAGSCTELNLMDRDIVNLPLVRKLGCPWLLVANIDPGGVFAQIVGTKACLPSSDWDMCVGVVVNKLRGEVKYFEPGPSMLQQMVGKPIFIVPYLYNLHIAEEDGMGVERRLAGEKSIHSTSSKGKPIVVVVAYPYVSMTDDLLPLESDARFELDWRRDTKPMQPPDAIILPGSRQTRSDMAWLQESGWDDYLREFASNGGRVLGLCGGYQMMGTAITDEIGVESGTAGSTPGLGLFATHTTLKPTEVKVVRPQSATLLTTEGCDDILIEGYEVHCGNTVAIDAAEALPPLVRLQDGQEDGFTNGYLHGCYVHGVLKCRSARDYLLLGPGHRFTFYEQNADEKEKQDPLDRLALHLESCGLDFGTLSNMLSMSDK